MGPRGGARFSSGNALKLYSAKKGRFPDTSSGLRALVETPGALPG